MDQGARAALQKTANSNGDGGGHTQEQLFQALQLPIPASGTSLTDLAKQDLEATLQLLAERAKYITGASGAAIALWEGDLMVCRASAGGSAPELGSHLQVNSGLSAESVRQRQTLRCDDTETDPRVNRESCRNLGIASVVVMPLIGERDVIGVFELFSDRPGAFAERDIVAVERLGEMIQTALVQVDAARRVEVAQRASEQVPEEPDIPRVAAPPENDAKPEEDAILAVESPTARTGSKGVVISIRHKPAEPDLPQPILAGELGKIGQCEACGFPISPGRVLCVDCEMGKTPRAALKTSAADTLPAGAGPARQEDTRSAMSESVPAFLAQYDSEIPDETGWLSSHKVLVGTLLLFAIAGLVLLLARAGVVRLPS